MAVQLVMPCSSYKTEFLSAMREFQAGNKELDWHSYPKQSTDVDFEEFLQSRQEVNLLSMNNAGSDLPGNRVTNIDYWLVSGNEWIGRLNLRLRLNEHLNNFGGHIGYEIRPSYRNKGYGKIILALGLEKAINHSIHEVLVICDEVNIASKRIIEGAGGRYEDTRAEPDGGRMRRYWFNLREANSSC